MIDLFCCLGKKGLLLGREGLRGLELVMRLCIVRRELICFWG